MIAIPLPSAPRVNLSRSSRLTLLILMLLAIGELLAPFLPPPVEIFHRLFHLLQMLWLIALGFVIRHEIRHAAAVGPQLARAQWQRVAGLLVSGALFSFVGDCINADLIDFTAIIRPPTLLSIPPFAVAHVCYLAAFVLLSRPRVHGSSSRVLGFTLAAVPLLAIGIWSRVIPAEAPRMVISASLAYSFVLAAMVVGSFWVALAWGKLGAAVALGGVLFLISDALLGYFLLRPRPFVAGQLIWSTYLLGQLLILRAGLLHRVAIHTQQAPS